MATQKEIYLTRPVEYTLKPPFPHNILVELNNTCNHNCIFCRHDKMKRKIRECDRDFTLDLIKQAHSNGSREIGFAMMCEPLMKKDLVDYISYCKKLGYEYIYLTSNGVLATLDRMKELINAGLSSIKISINAATRGTYIKVHGKDDFLQVKENVQKLHEYIDTNNIDFAIFLSFVKTLITQNETSLYEKEFAGLAEKIYFFDAVTIGNPMMELIDNKIVNPSVYLKHSDEFCEMVFNRIHITAEGYLNACCLDFDSVLYAADLHKMSLKEAWHCNAMQELRKRFLEKNLKGLVCYNCIHKVVEPFEPLNKELSDIVNNA